MRFRKISPQIEDYVVARKKNNRDLSCRAIAESVSKTFKISFSKSSVNFIIKKYGLSSPKGRRVLQIYRPQAPVACAGYVFLRSMDLLFGLSKMVAENLRHENPGLRLRSATVAGLTEAWLMAKAVYNVSIDRIIDYNKNDIWLLIGKKISKGAMSHFIGCIKITQLITTQIVAELTSCFQDVLAIKMNLADGTSFCLDGHFKTVWRDPKIPVIFSVTIKSISSYINAIIKTSEQTIIFSAKPDSMLSDEFSNFIFSFDGSLPSKRIRTIEILSTDAAPIREITFIMPGRRRFMIGVWPWQYQPIAEFEKLRARGKYVHEITGREFYYLEESVKFSQHAQNNIVILRFILIKSTQDGPATLAFLTNIPKEEMSAYQAVANYMRRFSDPEAEHSLMLDAVKTPPGYVENFLTSAKLLRQAKRLLDCADADNFFAVLVEILNMLALRSFFPAACSFWGLLKAREMLYKKQGYVKRDLADDVLFNLLIDKPLEENSFFSQVATKFNDASICEDTGRKLWLTLGNPAQVS